MKRILILLLAAVLLLGGCSGGGNEAKKESIVVTASFYPVWVLAANVVENVPGVELNCMTDAQTGCLHHYQLQSDDMKVLEASDLFLLGGAGMEDFLSQVTAQFARLKVADASEGVSLIADGDDVNPHVWLDVDAAMVMVQNMAKALSEVCPEQTEAFQKNADDYCADLLALKTEMTDILTECSCREMITSHDAFDYFAACFGFDILAVVAEDEESEPSPAHIQELTEMIRSHGLPAVFEEPDTTSAAVDTLARETGARLAVLDPVTTGEWKTDAYETAMRKNAQTLAEALQ